MQNAAKPSTTCTHGKSDMQRLTRRTTPTVLSVPLGTPHIRGRRCSTYRLFCESQRETPNVQSTCVNSVMLGALLPLAVRRGVWASRWCIVSCPRLPLKMLLRGSVYLNLTGRKMPTSKAGRVGKKKGQGRRGGRRMCGSDSGIPSPIPRFAACSFPPHLGAEWHDPALTRGVRNDKRDPVDGDERRTWRQKVWVRGCC